MPGDGYKFESSNAGKTASEIQELADDIKTILDTNLPNEMERLQAVWKSNAATSYKQQFEQTRAEFHIFYEEIKNMAESIIAASTQYNTADEESNVAGA